MLDYSQRKSFARAGAQNLDRTIAEARETVREQEQAEIAANRAAWAKRNEKIPFTTEQLKTATHVRTELGWHRIVRVNAKSVSVATAYSWTDRIPLDKIIEVTNLTLETEKKL